jgi:hypothetical protein
VISDPQQAGRLLVGLDSPSSASEGWLTDESLAESYRAIRKFATATDARVGICDLSSVTEFAVSTEFECQLANQEPARAEATRLPRIIVAPDTVGLGLSRMFQIMGEPTRSLLQIVLCWKGVTASVGRRSIRCTLTPDGSR